MAANELIRRSAKRIVEAMGRPKEIRLRSLVFPADSIFTQLTLACRTAGRVPPSSELAGARNPHFFPHCPSFFNQITTDSHSEGGGVGRSPAETLPAPLL